MNEVISVIVPVYNVEQYLDKCINSILNQTYKNIEVILVDDGSPDNCGKVCDEYSKMDSRIKVIHKENGGLSDARNVGIDNANGKYICFVDSDDYIENRYIELLYRAIKENNVDIAQCGINKISNDEIFIENIGYKKNEVKSSKKMLEDLYTTNWENILVWNKMYLKQIFEDVRFPKGKIHEDEFTTHKVLYKVEKISIVDSYLYNYRQNEDSITGKKFNLKRLDILEAIESRLDFFQKNKENELYKLTLENYLAVLRNMYINVEKYISDSTKIKKELKNKYMEKCKILLKNYDITFLKIIKMKLFIIFPYIYYLKFILKELLNSKKK